MGGALGGPGNITPHAEFNFYSDPVAAHEVMSFGLPITLMNLAMCRQEVIKPGDLSSFSGSGPLGKLAGLLLKNWFEQHPGSGFFDLCDPLTMALAIDPKILATVPGAVEVEINDPDRLGATSLACSEGPIRVARELDTERLFRLFFETLT